jgi:hypothetical protein
MCSRYLVSSDISYGWRFFLCSSYLVIFPMAGDCLCVLAT